MLHVRDMQFDADWKARLRFRIHKNLEDMLLDARTAHKARVAQVPTTNAELRLRLEKEHEQDIQTLRFMASEELSAELARGERERQLTSHSHSADTEQWNEAFVNEQMAILQTIRKQTIHTHPTIVQEHDGSSFEQGSSTRPSRSHHRSSSSVSSTYFEPQAIKIETEADREARLRREKHERQQEEFRKRAEAIKARKRQERELINRLCWSETMSSSSSNTSASSDQDPPPTMLHHEDLSKPLPEMSQEDIVNLVIFHNQQWAFIDSLPQLQWSDFPWPILSFESPKRKEELTQQAVGEYIFAPTLMHYDRALSKERLMEHIRKWHPDRFETKYVTRIIDAHERELVREGAGVVARILNDLLGQWNAV